MAEPVDDAARESLRLFDLIQAQFRGEVAEEIAQAIEFDEEFRHGRCRTDHVAGLGVCQTHGSPWAAGRFCDRMMARTHAAEIARSFGPRPVDNEPGGSDGA